jgi:hypothetical protein
VAADETRWNGSAAWNCYELSVGWVHDESKTVTLRFQAQDTSAQEQQVDLVLDKTGIDTTATATTTGGPTDETTSWAPAPPGFSSPYPEEVSLVWFVGRAS